MKTSMMHGIVAVAAICGLLGWVAPAGAVPWNPEGDEAAHFFYANGHDLNGLFGNPYVDKDNDTFHFPDALFHVSAPVGIPLQEDTLFVDITVKPGFEFGWMRVDAFGSWSATGPGGCVSFAGTLSMDELEGLGRNWSGPMDSDLPSGTCGPGGGNWTGWAEVDVSEEVPQTNSHLRVALQNTVEVTAEGGESAVLTLTYDALYITFGGIPEPASLALLAFGGLMLIRRR